MAATRRANAATPSNLSLGPGLRPRGLIQLLEEIDGDRCPRRLVHSGLHRVAESNAVHGLSWHLPARLQTVRPVPFVSIFDLESRAHCSWTRIRGGRDRFRSKHICLRVGMCGTLFSPSFHGLNACRPGSVTPQSTPSRSVSTSVPSPPPLPRLPIPDRVV